MPNTTERRFYIATELRLVGDGAAAKMVGHAAKFDVLSEDLGGFRERIAPGTFAKTIQSADIRALYNHDVNLVLGRNKAGTLRLSEDTAGLAFEIDPPDTQYARDLGVSMKRGDVNQMSFGFSTLQDKWAKIDGEWVRTLLEVELYDVSPVTYAAYPQTDVAVRALQAVQTSALANEAWRNDLLRRRLELAL